MPKPKEGESKDEFISRCMGYDDMQKYDQDQRAAICYSYWEKKDESTNISDIDIFIQRNKDRMDKDTLIGVMADKFNLDRIEAEEIVMRKVREENLDEKSKPVDIGYGQLVGIGRDSNGNKVAKFKTNTGKSFSIQTNNNLPSLHKETDLKDVDKSKAEKEVLDYIKKYGTNTQKQMLPESKIKEKFGYLDGKTVQLKSNTIVTDVDHNKKRMIMDTYVDVKEYPNYPSDYIIKGLNSGEVFQVRKSEFDSIVNQGGGRIVENYNDDIDEDNDAFIVDKPRGGYDVSIGGKFIGNFDDLDDVEEALKIWMKKNNWYPAVWFVDDHGGVDMYTLDEKIRNKKDIIEVQATFKVGNALIEKGDRIRIVQEEMFKGDNAYRFNDEITAKEIELYLENDPDLYRQQFLSIIENIKRKMKSGRYDHSLAPKLWMYFVDNGVKKYIKEFGSPGERIDSILTKKDRMTLAQKLADYYYDEITEGNYGDI